MQKRLIAAFLLVILTLPLVGCGGGSAPSPTASPAVTVQPVEMPAADPGNSGERKLPGGDQAAYDPLSGLTDEQRNSVVLLNHFVALTQQINASNINSLFLEQVVSSLIDNISFSKIDKDTLSQYNNTFKLLKSYLQNDIKRQRLQFLFEQDKARTVKELTSSEQYKSGVAKAGKSVLSVAAKVFKTETGMGMAKAAAAAGPVGVAVAVGVLGFAVARMAIESNASVNEAVSEVELKFIREGWTVDDAEFNSYMDSLNSISNYAFNIVHAYDLPDDLTLTDSRAQKFIEIIADANVARRIQNLESSRQTYLAYGDYWLELAQSYCENGDYEKCLEAIRAYEALDIRYLRKDYAYAKALPSAIASALEVYEGDQLIAALDDFTGKIIANCDDSDWFLRYYAAQIYTCLYYLSEDTNYLRLAYQYAKDNVSNLSIEQENQNKTYLAAIKEESYKPDATEAEKTKIWNYNALLKENRKKELPPVYEPLVLNCDLLFEVADMLEISEKDRAGINDILHKNDKPLFLSEALDQKYYYPARRTTSSPADHEDILSYWYGELKLPAAWVTPDTSIRVTVLLPDEAESAEYTDWTLDRVDRGTEGKLDTFSAVYTSPGAKKQHYPGGTLVTIEVVSCGGEAEEPDYTAEYRVVSTKKSWYQKLKFWDTDIWFKLVTDAGLTE